MRYWFLVPLLTFFVAAVAATPALAQPARAILLKIDGLHPAAIDRFGLANIQALRERGTYAEEGVMLFPAHPTVGAYGEWHTTSFPNVSALAGTAFLDRRPTFLQHVFRSRGKTLHAAGSASYRSLNDGFHYAMTASGVPDAQVIDFVVATFEAAGDVVFSRIMLQQTGNAGRVQSGKNLSDDPWAQNILHPDSPYGGALREADRQIGRLTAFLDARDQLDDTLFVVMGDGQSPGGWHLTLDEQAALTPIIFAGPGIAPGRSIPYAESIDVAPTVAALMEVSAPNADGGAGRVLTAMVATGEAAEHPRPLKTINAQIRTYRQLHARAMAAALADPKMNLLLMELDHALLSKHQFFTPERIMEWREAEDLDGVIQANAWVLETLRLALEESVYRFGAL